jgi:predicted metal-dependent enzyme (double-stranded beta helix superfamily)
MQKLSVPEISDLIARVKKAVEESDVQKVTLKVKEALEELILSKSIILPPVFQQSESDCYTRRLLYEDEKTGFVVVAMTWGPKQKTSLHDHAGVWCVEGVIQGEMQVDQYEKKETKGRDIRFIPRGHVIAGVGKSGALIPPFEHHVLSNILDTTSITIHVYEKNITSCTVYSPVKGDWYQEESRSLEYTHFDCP